LDSGRHASEVWNVGRRFARTIFGAQPALAVGERATRSIAEDRLATEDLGEAYVQGALGTAVPAAGHGLLGSIAPRGRSVWDHRTSNAAEHSKKSMVRTCIKIIRQSMSGMKIPGL
jgi:hypothetical protein